MDFRLTDEFKEYEVAHQEMMSLGKVLLCDRTLPEDMKVLVRREMECADLSHKLLAGSLSDASD